MKRSLKHIARIKQVFCVFVLSAHTWMSAAAQSLNPASSGYATESINIREIDNLVQLGFSDLRDGYSKRAIHTFEQAKRLDPTNGKIRFGLARALQDDEQKTRALEEYTISIFLDPGNAKAYTNRALVKGSLQDLAGALDDLDAAIKIDRHLAPAYMNRGITLAALNKPKMAIEDFDRAIEIDPRYADAYRNRGITRNFLGNLHGACNDWKQAGSLGQPEPWSWYRQLCRVNSNGPIQTIPRHPSQR